MAKFPTVFPIIFAAIVARFLRILAALKLEHGTNVITVEQLLSSSTVFQTLASPVKFRHINFTTLSLIILWALSPIGGQAGLRFISTGPSYTNRTNNFSYVSFVSGFSNGGVTSASAEPLVAINGLFTSTLASSASSKSSPQDLYGNIKVPLLESLPPTTGDDLVGWRTVPDTSDVVWSSLVGIPVDGLVSEGSSFFSLNTGYMVVDCKVSGHDFNGSLLTLAEQERTNLSSWSGANYGINPHSPATDVPLWFNFTSYDSFGEGFEENSLDNLLTTALCNVTMQFVELNVDCHGLSCRGVSIRLSPEPNAHNTTSHTWLNSTNYSPLTGLNQSSTMYTYFFANFVNATSPNIGCDDTFCPPAPIEGYLVNPGSPFSETRTQKIWKIGDRLVSQRFTQLINSYWLASIAPYAVAGGFPLTHAPVNTAEEFNTDRSPGIVQSEETVIRCHIGWLVMLLLASIGMFLASIASAVMQAFRKGPEILDSFSALLRDSPYAKTAKGSSMEDAPQKARRLRHAVVQLGDVTPERDVGFVALGIPNEDTPIERLTTERLYS